MDPVQFDLVGINENNETEYAAQHELWNVVKVTFPEGYFTAPRPAFITVDINIHATTEPGFKPA